MRSLSIKWPESPRVARPSGQVGAVPAADQAYALGLLAGDPQPGGHRLLHDGESMPYSCGPY